jgi:3D (Asp-Asp-Asp) domain-containing protein
MGTYVCEDRGGAIKGNKIDIYMLTKKEAFEFGRRNLMAQVVSE